MTADRPSALDALGFYVNQLCKDNKKHCDEEIAPQLAYHALTTVLIQAYQLLC